MNIPELKAFAVQFLQKLTPNVNGATVIGLRGDLGAGKTTFTQICADLFSIKENVTSPTFVILKKYRLDGKFFGEKFSVFIHIDAYRLKSGKELQVLGWREIISNPKNLIFVEWPELVSEVMPEDTVYIDFKHIDETTREVSVK